MNLQLQKGGGVSLGARCHSISQILPASNGDTQDVNKPTQYCPAERRAVHWIEGLPHSWLASQADSPQLFCV